MSVSSSFQFIFTFVEQLFWVPAQSDCFTASLHFYHFLVGTLNSSFLFLPPLSLAASSRTGKCPQGKSSSVRKAYLPDFPPVLHPSSAVLHFLISSSTSSRRFCPAFLVVLIVIICPNFIVSRLTLMEVLCSFLKN